MMAMTLSACTIAACTNGTNFANSWHFVLSDSMKVSQEDSSTIMLIKRDGKSKNSVAMAGTNTSKAILSWHTVLKSVE